MMKLGAFSVSLNVADIPKSREFYERLGFSVAAGDADQGWLILRNDSTTIGLFKGMFERNMLTFNPGWDAASNTLDKFDDVREIQRELLKHGIPLDSQTDDRGTGPGSIMLSDPDGNPILIDQHV
jgi:catechol 2,3-dioxygenase-like lactoylglutathione lyase family enzyme